MSECSDLGRITNHPGYRAILRTVLKTQIKQLVEQLSFYAGEEAILLSASLSDGALSHIGSKSGETFLTTHGHIKEQFLGFCRRYKILQQHKETGELRNKDQTEAGEKQTVITVASPKRQPVPENEKDKEVIDASGNNKKMHDNACVANTTPCPSEASSSYVNTDSDVSSDMEMETDEEDVSDTVNSSPVAARTDGNAVDKDKVADKAESRPATEGMHVTRDTVAFDLPGTNITCQIRQDPLHEKQVTRNKEAAENHEATIGMHMTCDNILHEIPDNKVTQSSTSKQSVTVKEEPDSDVSENDSMDVADACNNSTNDPSQLSAMLFKTEQGSWTALEAEERFKEREKVKVRAPKRRRATSSLETKYKAVMLYKSGKTICTVSKEVNYARSTVSEWIQNANKIVEEYEKNDYNPQIKGFYTCRHPELEKILLEWVRDAKTNKVYISPQVIIDKSYDIAEDLGITDFHCNENWVRRFKLRYSLVTKRQSTS